MGVTIRPATPSDLALLSHIEQASDQLLRTVNLSPVADLPPYPPEMYRSLVEAGQAWVAFIIEDDDSDSHPAGFVSVRIFENCREGKGENGSKQEECCRTVFINQLSVYPHYGGRGTGTKLMRHVEAWAAEGEERGCTFQAIELTTFADVPFNKPFYERLGYYVLSEEELGEPRAQGVRDALGRERSDAVLGRWERVGMRKML